MEIIDKGWKADANKPVVDMTLRYTQYAGHRDTEVDVFFNRDVSDYQFSTGIINVKGSEEFSDKKGLRACWGTDWPSTDTLKWKRETVGLAIWVPTSNVAREIPAEKGSHGGNYAFVVKMPSNTMSYKVAYSSANEDFGMHSSDEWFEWVRTWKKEVESPVKVKLQRIRR